MGATALSSTAHGSLTVAGVEGPAEAARLPRRALART